MSSIKVTLYSDEGRAPTIVSIASSPVEAMRIEWALLVGTAEHLLRNHREHLCERQIAALRLLLGVQEQRIETLSTVKTASVPSKEPSKESDFTKEELALGERMFDLQPESPWTAFGELRELFGEMTLERRQELHDVVAKRRAVAP